MYIIYLKNTNDIIVIVDRFRVVRECCSVHATVHNIYYIFTNQIRPPVASGELLIDNAWPAGSRTPRHVKRQIPIFPLNPPATLTTTTSSTGSCISSSSSSGGGSSSSCNRLTFSPPPPKPRAVCVFIGFPYSSPPRPRCRQNNSRFPANRPFESRLIEASGSSESGVRAPAKSYGGVCHSRLAKLRNGDGGQRSYISAGMASGTIRASIYLRRAKTFGPPSTHSLSPSSVRQSPSPLRSCYDDVRTGSSGINQPVEIRECGVAGIFTIGRGVRSPPFRQTPLPRRTTAVVNPLRRVRQLLPPYTQSAITTATAAIAKLEYQSTEITPSYPVTRPHIAVRQSFRLRRRAVIVDPASLYI
ncbi:Uncharacterized protein FWK35_00000250 [Aphis craccivora]|uniref:Uncharacterized protein n=1 Tax=Aphis craccivora TaxID=307492 RepID=A0A6G0ZS68_APHCR|nr:Uncharacterized protein FWK35_00000250 [Aphis craccivora]